MVVEIDENVAGRAFWDDSGELSKLMIVSVIVVDFFSSQIIALWWFICFSFIFFGRSLRSFIFMWRSLRFFIFEMVVVDFFDDDVFLF